MKRLAAVIALIAGLIIVPVVPAQAAACTGTTGVTVVVDYGPLGGGVTIACAPGDPKNGIEALRQAGFTVTGTQNWGIAFVCRINNKPGPDTESCVDTPPGSAHWGYSYASRGGSWTMSEKGATARKPPQGSVEGWAFGSGVKPSVAPPAAPPPPPPPPPPAPQTPARTTTAVTPASAAVTATDTAPSAAASSSVAAPSPVFESPSENAAQIPLGSNNFTGTAIAIGLLAVLAAAALYIARRRSH